LFGVVICGSEMIIGVFFGGGSVRMVFNEEGF